MAEVLGLCALVLILAEGGLTTNWAHARPAMGGALLLATLGVVVATAVVAGCAHWLLGFDWRSALLLGAVLAPTDAAAVFSVLRAPAAAAAAVRNARGGIRPQRPALGPGGHLAVVGRRAAHRAAGGASRVGLAHRREVAWALIGGLAIGLVTGLVGGFLLRRAALPSSGLYPVAVLGLIVAVYGAASVAAASGFLAVYVTAVVLGNARLPHNSATRGFAEGVAWLAQIGLFVMLGLLASPAGCPPDPARAAGRPGRGLPARPVAVAPPCSRCGWASAGWRIPALGTADARAGQAALADQRPARGPVRAAPARAAVTASRRSCRGRGCAARSRSC